MAAEQNVLDIISQARTYAQDSYDSADSLVQNATTAALAISVPTLPVLDYQVEIPELDRSGVQEPGDVPVFDDANLNKPDSPQLLSLHEIQTPDFDGITPPQELDLDALFNQSPPNLDVPTFDRTAPTVRDTDVPDTPMLSLPENPELVEVTVPDAPTFRVPSFDPERPGERPDAPPDAVATFKTSLDEILPELRNYLEGDVDAWITKHAPDHHTQMQKLEDRLAKMLEGGTGLPEDVEQKIYDRARARNEADRRDADAQAAERAAQMGHTMPPGAMLDGMRRAAQSAANNNASTNAEIAIEQARLEQNNLQFAIQASTQLRQMVLNTALQYAGQLAQINGQAIQYASSVAQTMTQLYNARVQLFQTEVSYFQAQAQVYDVELRAAFAELERYEALVRMEEIKGRLNEQQISQYRQQLESERTKLGLYSEQLRGEALKLDHDRARIDAFGAEVQAFNAQVGAKEMEFRAYTAALEGDRSKVQGYTSSVEAYRSRIQAESTRVGAEASYAEAINAQNRTQTEIFRNEMQAYGTDAQVRQSQYQGEIRAYLAGLDRYQADLQYTINEARTRMEGEQLRFNEARAKFDTEANINIEHSRNFLQRAQTMSEAALSGARVYGDIAGNAVSAQNTMVSLANETLSTGE